MGYRINRLPAGTTMAEFFHVLAQSIRDNRPLPRGWDVTWIWRNTVKQERREGPVMREVRKSRAGFIGLMLRRLNRDASAQGIDMNVEPRRATSREIADLEELEEEEEE